MSFTSFERRWIDATLPSFLDESGALTVRDGEVDYAGAMEAMRAAANLKARLGMHLAVWLAALAPAWMLGRPQTIDEVPPPVRAHILDRMTSHRVFLVRGMGLILKLNASLALMRAPAVRARTRYDGADRAEAPRRALPLAAQEG